MTEADEREVLTWELFVWKDTDRWINFPWPTLPPVAAPIEVP